MAADPVADTAAPAILSSSTVVQDDADGPQFLRLATGDIIAVSARDRHRPLAVLLPLDAHWAVRLSTAERLRARLLGLRAAPGSLTLQQRHRIALALRALDGHEAHVVLRTIAEQLYGAERVRGEHWKTSPLKAQVARLIAHGRHLTEQGYHALLLGQKPTGRGKRGD